MKLPKLDLAVQKTCKPAMLGRMRHASRRALNLKHSPAHQFACSQWQAGHRPTNLYLLYRWLIFIAMVSIGISSFASQQLPKAKKEQKNEDTVKDINYFKWFIYFTNWGFMLIIVQSALALAVVHRFRADNSYNLSCEEDDFPTSRKVRTPLLCRAYWLAQNIATDLAFVITPMYWTKVHDPGTHELNTMNLLVHGGNSVVMLCEIAVTAQPIRAAHALYGAAIGLVYGVFSACYWAVGGTDKAGNPAIYPLLDWNKPGSALGFVALCAVVMVLAHAFATLLAMLRMRLARRLRHGRPQSDCITLPTH